LICHPLYSVRMTCQLVRRARSSKRTRIARHRLTGVRYTEDQRAGTRCVAHAGRPARAQDARLRKPWVVRRAAVRRRAHGSAQVRRYATIGRKLRSQLATVRPSRALSNTRKRRSEHVALVAQGIEHRFPKPCVACSNHAEGAPPSQVRVLSRSRWSLEMDDQAVARPSEIVLRLAEGIVETRAE
jgi:hypothetical protein